MYGKNNKIKNNLMQMKWEEKWLMRRAVSVDDHYIFDLNYLVLFQSPGLLNFLCI